MYGLEGFSAGSIAQAEQEAQDFASWLGWPTWFDWAGMVKNLLQAGLQANPTEAYQSLWAQLSEDRQKLHENAYFGLTKQQFLEQSNHLADMYELYTGDDAVPKEIRNQALKEHWTQTELMHHLQKNETVGATSPWIAVGLSYRDVLSQFGSQYGVKPQSKEQLGSWWKFRTGAQQVGAGGPAGIQYQPPQPRGSSADVETR